MISVTRITSLGAAVLLLGVLGCSNPADSVPAAEVSAAGEATESAAGKRFTLDEGSTLGFVGSKVTGSHEGGFHGFGGEINLVDGDPSRSRIELVMDTTTLWADNEKLAGHLKSPDFFDVETHPKATFVSSSIASDGDGYLVTGNLSLHGVTKSISFPANISVEEERITATAEVSIMRFDFDIVYPGPTDDLIRDEVVIKF